MISKRQKKVLDFIKYFLNRNGYSPSLEEIKQHLHLASVSTAHHHVKSLEKSGYLKKQTNLPRSIEVIDIQPMIQIPILGCISAGQPILAVQDREIISVPRTNIKGDIRNLFALKVVGQSMIDENINNGDVVVVYSQSTAKDGQKIVALINNEEVTLKKIYREKKRVRLQPANPKYTSIVVNPENLIIQGVVIDIIKNTESTDNSNITNLHKHHSVFPKKFDNLINQVIEGDCLEIMNFIIDKDYFFIFISSTYFFY